jgi:hypothetical protein
VREDDKIEKLLGNPVVSGDRVYLQVYWSIVEDFLSKARLTWARIPQGIHPLHTHTHTHTHTKLEDSFKVHQTHISKIRHKTHYKI